MRDRRNMERGAIVLIVICMNQNKEERILINYP